MIPIYKPYMPELPEIDSILHGGEVAYGRYTKEFEEKLKTYFRTPYVLVTNSFNTAISVSLSAMDIAFGDEIIASPMACLASTQPYLSSGIHVKWADIDPLRGTLDPESVKKNITLNTKAIVHNHFCGYPGYIEEINTIGKEYGIPVIDDGIECFGSEYKGKLIGSCGTDVTIFSCNPVRIPNTIDGGIIVFKEKKIYEQSLLIRDCGINRALFRDDIGEINMACDISIIGYSATMSNVNGYIGSQQMDQVDDLIKKQRYQAQKWNEYFDNQSRYVPIYCKNCNPNYWVYGILCNNKRETITQFRKLGFYASGVHMKNNIYSVFGMQDNNLKGVDEFYNSFVALPCGWWINE